MICQLREGNVRPAYATVCPTEPVLVYRGFFRSYKENKGALCISSLA